MFGELDLTATESCQVDVGNLVGLGGFTHDGGGQGVDGDDG